jgi:CHASE2 domain-containing sensor protein
MIRFGNWLGEYLWIAVIGVMSGGVGAIAGLFLGVGLQLLLHVLGIAPSVSSTNGTDWYGVVPPLLCAGVGITLGVQAGLDMRRRSRGDA